MRISDWSSDVCSSDMLADLQDAWRELVALALHPLAQQFSMTADGLGTFARTTLRRLLESATQLHFAENALAPHLLFQRAQGLIDVVVKIGRASCRESVCLYV